MKKMWDERFSKVEYVYGTEPNIFFKEQIDKLKPGKLLLFGEGEGRNAVYAASLGWIVDAVDWSESAKQKAINLSVLKKVSINYFIDDFHNFEPKKNYYDAVGLIYIHLEEEIRAIIHKKLADALSQNGKIIFEAFHTEQLGKKSGGPQNINLLFSLEDLVTNFIDLDFEFLAKEKINLNEGTGHIGEAFVVRFVGVKSVQ